MATEATRGQLKKTKYYMAVCLAAAQLKVITCTILCAKGSSELHVGRNTGVNLIDTSAAHLFMKTTRADIQYPLPIYSGT